MGGSRHLRPISTTHRVRGLLPLCETRLKKTEKQNETNKQKITDTTMTETRYSASESYTPPLSGPGLTTTARENLRNWAFQLWARISIAQLPSSSHQGPQSASRDCATVVPGPSRRVGKAGPAQPSARPRLGVPGPVTSGLASGWACAARPIRSAADAGGRAQAASRVALRAAPSSAPEPREAASPTSP